MLGSGCKNDNQLSARRNDSIGVTIGDFDNVAEPLNRMVVRHTAYEGVISTTTWDPDYDRDLAALSVEGLLSNADELFEHDAVFVASGTRGLGERQYNGLAEDNQLVTNEEIIANVQEYVEKGNTLLVTDWGYDLIEAAWPEYITFVNDDQVLDSAQRGDIGDVVASVTDQLLRSSLETDTLNLNFNFSNWAVIESVDDSMVEVLMQGDVDYLTVGGDGVISQPDTPLLVRFMPTGSGDGQVVFASFHLDAQNDYAIDQMLRTVVGEFKENDPEGMTIAE